MREASFGGLPTALIHTEGLPDRRYITTAGPKNLLSVVPDSMESAIESAYQALREGFRVVAIDTLSATEPLCDKALGVGDFVPFASRKAAFHGLSLLREEAIKRDSLVIVVNQLRVAVNDLVPKPRSSFEGTINKLCAVRIRTLREQTRNEYGKLAYLKVRFNIYRSLVCPPSDRAYGFLFNQEGFNRGFELMRALLANNTLSQAGAYLKSPDGSSLGPGYLEAAKQIENEFNKYWRYYNGGSQSNDP
tara:strand:- start:11623 stop:12366 length:744 start_codon:yes stop_codon:yes gene_type:complete